MSLIASLPEIDKWPQSVYVLHEKLERYIPVHQHKKGQLSYVEGGIAYVHIKNKTFVIPARHYFWIPYGIEHILKVSHSATVLRSIFFYVFDDDTDPFYSRVGIYPINDLLLQMIKYTDKWEGPVGPGDRHYQFLSTIKNLLPEISTRVLPIALPSTDNERMLPIMGYIDLHIAEEHTLQTIGKHFGLSNRSLSRLFQATLGISFLQYLKLLRMVKAFEMILQTDMPMSEIAYAIGYHSLSAFSNTFYQFTNLRPSNFSDYK
ncbi:helix-turn-helix domain-containing protein [Mucilaginibacter sp. SP1R1]|uniref:helix-turn-helix domain-containing protein n=1 Tax=Mucilaginibacter sp. SP1R1 TaxID=2723091 RepID=UPI001611FE67|nr:AraC family transcriptional regulator [Mucilaginibacter sp. SP1R1]MBB6148534.1 AraC-like DNA-binding protein [Mucilaginibacter sp. SP1R1]